MKNGKNGEDGILRGLDHRTTYRFARIAALHARAFSKAYASKFKLTVNTWKVLSVIGRYSPLSAHATGTHSALEPDKVTRAVDVLVNQGYVLRRQDPADRRRVVLSLSVKGKRAHDELSRIRDAIEHEFLGVLSPAEIASLYKIVDKLEAQAVKLFSDKEIWGRVLDGLTEKTEAGATAARRPGRRAASAARSAA